MHFSRFFFFMSAVYFKHEKVLTNMGKYVDNNYENIFYRCSMST